MLLDRSTFGSVGLTLKRSVLRGLGSGYEAVQRSRVSEIDPSGASFVIEGSPEDLSEAP